MSSRWKTGRRWEALDALPFIVELARDTLDSNVLEEAENLAIMLVGSKGQKRRARARLMEIVAPPPKRPLYYLKHEICFLPRWTRDTIRYCGDYIDLLVKEMTYEFTGDSRVREYSLGRNLRILKPRNHGIPSELIDKLKRYNSFLYRPGKHDFILPRGRGHRFTSKEAVLTAFVTMKLADEIKLISQLAEEVSSR